jgi:hypothetical protein
VKSPAVEDAAAVYGVYGVYEDEQADRRRLTAEEAQRVQALITEGMSPAMARAEVLGEVL